MEQEGGWLSRQLYRDCSDRSSLPDWLVSCCSLFQGVSSRLGTATAQDGAANHSGLVIAWPVGLALRGIFIDHGMPPIAFALVTLVFNGVLLLVWRWPLAMAHSMKH